MFLVLLMGNFFFAVCELEMHLVHFAIDYNPAFMKDLFLDNMIIMLCCFVTTCHQYPPLFQIMVERQFKWGKFLPLSLGRHISHFSGNFIYLISISTFQRYVCARHFGFPADCFF